MTPGLLRGRAVRAVRPDLPYSGEAYCHSCGWHYRAVTFVGDKCPKCGHKLDFHRKQRILGWR